MEQQNTTSQQESDSHITLKSILGGDILVQFSEATGEFAHSDCSPYHPVYRQPLFKPTGAD